MQRATYKGNVPCILNQEFLFLVHKYWGSEVTRLGWSVGSYETSSTRKPCAKAVPETDSITQQKQYHKRTTLRTLKLPLQSIRSKEGPHYRLGAKRDKAVIRQATNAIYGMGTLKLPLQSIHSKEGPHYRLGAKRDKAVIRQATNAIHGMGMLKLPLQSIHSEEGPHYRLGAKCKEAVIRQATINPIHKFEYPLVIPYPGCTA